MHSNTAFDQHTPSADSSSTVPAQPQDQVPAGTAAIRRAMEVIHPVAIGTDMLEVLEVFRRKQQEHFFPVLDELGKPLGLICERSLKSYVYSRFGMALLANRGQSHQLDSFLTPCPGVEITGTIEQVLEAAHAAPGTEGVLITAGGCYAGFIRASALVEMAHEQQLEIVHRHNIELDQKSREIQAVLQNMRQGICTILPDLTLHADFSAHLSNILEQDQLAGVSLMQALFRHSNLGADALQQIEAALMAILGQDALMFDCNAHLLPTELVLELAGRHKVVELHWNPMLDEQEEVSRLMLVVRDISQMRALQQQAEQQRHELQLLGDILAAGQQRFTAFMESSTSQLQLCQQLVLGSDQPDPQGRDLLYRHLHTIKGNARTLGLQAVTDNLHAAEQILQDARAAGHDIDLRSLQQAIEQVGADFDQYARLYRERLQGFGREPSGRVVSQSLWQQLQVLADTRQDNELQALLAHGEQRNLGELLDGLGSNLDGLARELGKAVPQLTISSELRQCYLSSGQGQQLSDALVHMLRNCLDHGIEPAGQRLAAGKPEAGCIHIDGGLESGGLRLQIGDDGRGLALTQLHAKAVAGGQLAAGQELSDDQLAELIFQSGLSTAGQVSMISGRGVGMDAVRSTLRELGGTIRVVWSGPRQTDGYRPFRLEILLPR